MTEKPEIAEAGVEAVSGIDPAAIGLALAAASRERADTFLAEQTRLVRLQAEELSHELDVRRWSLWVRHLSGLLKLTFEIGLAMVALGVACFIAAAVWNAAHADGLVIESFSVPPDMAQRGLTGQVIASKTLDELTTMGNQTVSWHAAKAYANNWGDDVKVEIPETGVSVGEAYRFLKSWLGHETHISGEVVRTTTGVAITARVSGDNGFTIRGTEDDLDNLVRKIAEHIYASTQPFRYSNYLSSQRRRNEIIPVAKAMITSGPVEERSWGYLALHLGTVDSTDIAGRIAIVERALSVQPGNGLALSALSSAKAVQGHDEEALQAAKRLQMLLRSSDQGDVATARVSVLQKGAEVRIAAATGDFQKAAQNQAGYIAQGGGSPFLSVTGAKAVAEIGAHDLRAARATMANSAGSAVGSTSYTVLSDLATRMKMDNEAENWAAVLTRARTLDQLLAKYPALRTAAMASAAPEIANAQAWLGDFAAAERTIAPAPATCYPCSRARAGIAVLQRQNARADFWFAQAAAVGPSLPFAHTEWGQALLARGDLDAAIAKFAIARQKGPHFADPLVYWGEALMAKNQSHLALAKFAAANQYAPNWGRLHLKWGEALFYAGKKAEAQEHFTRAAQIDLTPSEKSELTRARAHV